MVQIKVFFPTLEARAKEFRMEVQGRVLREEPREPGRLGGGFAVLNESFVLRDNELGKSR